MNVELKNLENRPIEEGKMVLHESFYSDLWEILEVFKFDISDQAYINCQRLIRHTEAADDLTSELHILFKTEVQKLFDRQDQKRLVQLYGDVLGKSATLAAALPKLISLNKLVTH